MDILEGLNTEQLGAVKHTDGPLLVVAGAGTGKTQVITRRIANLISEGKAKPSQILSLTFTETAAREMEERLHGLIGWQSFQVPIRTFNAFGAELLGRYSGHIGRSTGGGLINSTQKALLLQQHINEIDFEYYGPQSNLFEFLEGIVKYIEKLQNAAVDAPGYLNYVSALETSLNGMHPSDILEQHDLAALYSLYERVKETTGTYDYYDQLSLPLRILRERPNLAARLTNEYRYVLVDEYQDTSPVQDELLRAFVPPNGNIFAVGDDDQSIYAFRGADIDNILSFTSHFNVEKPTALVRNYRSGQPILDAAYRLIKNNDPDRLESRLSLDKRLIALNDDGVLEFSFYPSPVEEYATVANKIEIKLHDGVMPRDIGVLARSNASLRMLAKVLESKGIPFALSAETNVFSQREIINLWYLIQWLGGKADVDSIAHVLMGPLFMWSPAQYRKIAARSKLDMSSPEDALRAFEMEGDEESAFAIKQLDEWRSWSLSMPVSQLAYRLVFDGGLADRLRAQGANQPRVLRVFEDLQRLLAHMQDYEAVALDNTLSGYIQSFPIPPKLQSGGILGDENGVQLLTVHASKGLEFETVYIMNCTQRSWSERNGGGLEVPIELSNNSTMPPEHEQRRLLYVAATRAKRELYVSAPSATMGGQSQAPSPLVSELFGKKLVDDSSKEKIDKSELLMQKLQRIYPLKETVTSDLLPFETSDGWLQLGVGSLEAYDVCPYDFFLQHVLGIREPFGAPMAFGSVIHNVIQSYYGARLRGETADLAHIYAKLDELWHDGGYESQEAADADHERARQALSWFFERETTLEKVDPHQRQILGSEVKMILELPEAKLRLKGRIDAYFKTPDGIEIRDFKTGRGKTDPEKLSDAAKKSFQLRTYALGYEMMNNKLPSKVTLDYLVTRTEGSAQLTARVLQNHREKLASLADRIRKRDFAPAPASQFHHCAATKFYGDEEDMNEMDTLLTANGSIKGEST